MRLSINLDPDLHQIATARARARNTSISKEINELLRSVVCRPPADDASGARILASGRRGFPVSHGLVPFTGEDAAHAEDDEDLRHLHPEQ